MYSDELEMSTMAYSFLAVDTEEGQGLATKPTVENTTINMRSRTPATTNTGTVPRDINTHVFSWGLNDKEQLGGPKGSKVCLYHRCCGVVGGFCLLLIHLLVYR